MIKIFVRTEVEYTITEDSLERTSAVNDLLEEANLPPLLPLEATVVMYKAACL